MGRLIAKVNDVQFVTDHSFLFDLLIWSKPHFFIIGNTTTTEVDFFDSAFTFTNESIEVGCCSPNTTLTKVTCGQGTSCTGECSAIGASLCPSGNCTEDPEDCSPSLLLEQASREDSPGKERAATSRPSWELRWCAPGCSTLQIHYNLSSLEMQRYCSETLPPGCKVRKHSACCFHPTCRSRKRRVCKWLNYFTGEF